LWNQCPSPKWSGRKSHPEHHQHGKILHDSIHWKDAIDVSLWHQSVTYATHIYNNHPRYGVCPEDIFIVSPVPRHHLMDLHIWGFLFMFWIQKYNKGELFLDGTLVPGEACFWNSANKRVGSQEETSES
jgi:hypothetical protein